MAKVISGNRQLRHMKTIFRRGLNTTSGNFTQGSKVRIIHSPGGRR